MGRGAAAVTGPGGRLPGLGWVRVPCCLDGERGVAAPREGTRAHLRCAFVGIFLGKALGFCLRQGPEGLWGRHPHPDPGLKDAKPVSPFPDARRVGCVWGKRGVFPLGAF